MSFEPHECYCTADTVDGNGAFLPDCTIMDYIGDGVWKCPECGGLSRDHSEDIYKARVEIKLFEFNGKTYREAIVIPPFNEKLLSHMTDTGGNKTSELKKDCLEEFLNDSCYDTLRGHKEGVFDMEILFYDYATGGDGGEREVVIEVCKETQVQFISKQEGTKNE